MLIRAALICVCACAAAAAAGELEVSVTRARVAAGARQGVSVAGLPLGEEALCVWLGPHARVRGRWPLAGNARGEAHVDFRTRGALAGKQWVVVSIGEGDGVSAAFEVFDQSLPTYLSILKVNRLVDDREAERRARDLGFSAVGRQGTPRPSSEFGWLAEVMDGGPQFLRLDADRVSALRTAHARAGVRELLKRPACLSDRGWSAQVWRWYGPRAAEAARSAPWLWSLGDGVWLAPEDGSLDFCTSSYCQRRFASTLKRRHLTLSRLNSRWGTAFKIWGDVYPATMADVAAALTSEEEIVRETGLKKLASWCDHRAFMDRTWREGLSLARDVTMSTHRSARVGLTRLDLTGVFGGADAPRLLQGLDWASVPATTVDLALARSLAPRRVRVLTELDGDHVHSLWRGLAHGNRGCVLRGDGAADDVRGESSGLSEAVGKITGGLGQYFEHATWEADPVAVVYSRASMRIERALGGGRTRPGALATWLQILSDLGVSARVMDEDAVAQGGLRRMKCRVVILPRCYVLGRRAASRLAAFARSGGVVVADADAALFDENLQPVGSRRMEDLFGIDDGRSPVPAWAGESPEVVFRGVAQPGAYIDGVDPGFFALVDCGLRSLGGVALCAAGEAEGMITNPYGHGRAIYLNAGLERYAQSRDAPLGASYRRLVRNALELAPTNPRIHVLVDGEPLAGCECSVWRLDESLIFVLYRDGGLGEDTVDAELVFARSGFCYDTLDGVLLGEGKRIETRLPRGASVFALLPYDVDGIKVDVWEKAGAFHFKVLVETSTYQSWTHLLCQQMLDPRGRVVPGTTSVHLAERGVSRGSAAFARNEPAGEYTLVLRDVLTGVEGAVTLVKEPGVLETRFPVTNESR